MESESVVVNLKIRRFDLANGSQPEVSAKSIELHSDLEYVEIKKLIQDVCKIEDQDDNKVIKLRKSDEVLVPFSFLLEPTCEPNAFFYVDICKINYAGKPTATLLQDAYIDSVCHKLCNMESRIVKAEELLPQLEWRRQAHMEETVGTLSNKVSFLNRRVDELLPVQWRSKMPQTMA